MQDAKQTFLELRRKGIRQDEARRKVSVSRQTAREWERGARQHFRWKPLRPEIVGDIRRLLEREGVSFDEVSRRIGCCKRTVIRWAQKIRREYANPSGQMAFSDRAGYCPIHGQLTVVPCVACASKRPKSHLAIEEVTIDLQCT